jgi:hypothetical protein
MDIDAAITVELNPQPLPISNVAFLDADRKHLLLNPIVLDHSEDLNTLHD